MNDDCMFYQKLTIVRSVPDISVYICTEWNAFKFGTHIVTFFEPKHDDIYVQIL